MRDEEERRIESVKRALTIFAYVAFGFFALFAASCVVAFAFRLVYKH